VDYAQQQRNPGKHAMGIGIVLAMHVVLGWALVTGLAQRMVEVLKQPIETKIIEEVKPPPPPPPENLPPPPKFAPPPPSFVPPPEVNVNPPPVAAPTITTVTTPPPPAPVVIAPPAPVPPPVVAHVSPKPLVSNMQACAPSSDDYPSAARRAETTGTTRVRLTIGTDGKLVNAEIVKSAGPSREHKMLDRTVLAKLSECAFKAATDETGKPVQASLDVDYVWKLQ